MYIVLHFLMRYFVHPCRLSLTPDACRLFHSVACDSRSSTVIGSTSSQRLQVPRSDQLCEKQYNVWVYKITRLPFHQKNKSLLLCIFIVEKTQYNSSNIFWNTSIHGVVFVMTTKTASVGITLTAGSHVVFLEPCNDAHVRKQAIGRVWRIGQKNPITVTTLKTLGTVDCVSDLDSHLNISNQTGTAV